MKPHLVTNLVCFAFVTASLATIEKTIEAKEAAQHVGETVVVTGTIAEVQLMKNGSITLEFDAPYPNQSFSAYIPKELVVGDIPQSQGMKRSIYGTIELNDGKPEIRLEADMLQLFDKAYSLQRLSKKQQYALLLQKDDSMKVVSLSYFDKPDRTELFDRAAFEYLLKKGELRSIFNSYIFGIRAGLKPDEQKELLAAHPELAGYEEGEAPGFFVKPMTQSEGLRFLDKLSRLNGQYKNELAAISKPFDHRINSINSEINFLLARQHQ